MDFKTIFPGLSVAVVTGLAALFLSQHYGAPAMLFALLLGIALSFLSQDHQCKPGIEFTASFVLRVGVALLGLRIALDDLISLGWQNIVLLAAAIFTTIIFGMVLARLLGLNQRFGALTGGSVAICGASAAMAITAIMPDHPDKERDTLLTVIGVTSLSTIAMVVYPIIASTLNLDSAQAGLFLGGTIHDVAQVVGAGYSMSAQTGDLSTLVKLVRVALLMPVVMVMLLVIKRQHGAAQSGQIASIPWFLTAFVVLMLINSFIELPSEVVEYSTYVSRFALVIAITAIGMKSNLAKLACVGLTPIILILAETVWIAVFILSALFIA